MDFLNKNNRRIINRNELLLTLVLSFICVILIWFSTRSGGAQNLFFGVAGIIGIIILFLSLMNPLIGFYICIVSSFFIFIIVRFLNSDIPLVSLIDVMVYVVFIGIMIDKLLKREKFWKSCSNPIVFLYGLILIYYLIEFFNPNAISKEIYFLLFRRFITILLFFYCAIQLFTTFERIKQFFRIIIFLAILAAVYGVFQKWFGIPAFEIAYFERGENGPSGLGMLDNGEYRIPSFVSDCTAFGLLMSGVLIILLSIELNYKRPYYVKGMFIFFIVLMALAMSYSGTRTATFMLFVEVCLYILITSTKRKTILFSFFFAIVLGAIFFAPSYGNSTLIRLKSTFETEDESLKVRDVNRKFIQPYIHSHPLGGGVGSTGVVNIKYNTGHPLAGFPTDSGLLAMALEFGWIGLILQCLTYFVTLQQGIRGYFRSNNQKFKLIFIGKKFFLILQKFHKMF